MALIRFSFLVLMSLFIGPISLVTADEWGGLKLEGRLSFTEGPVWHSNGNLYFSDIENNRIMRRDPTGVLHVFKTPSGRSNGLAFDGEGRLVACEVNGEGGNRRVTRVELDGTLTVLSDSFEGGRYNSPNDLVIDSKERIYFTDPCYRGREAMEILDGAGKKVEGVYRIDPDGSVVRVITHEVDRPNGIAISSDERFLFVADNNPDERGMNRKLWRFDLKEDGSVDLASQAELFDWGNDRGPDGMAIDVEDRLYVAAGLNFPALPSQTAEKYKAGIYVISAEGKLEKVIPIPTDMITNCAFGGDDLKTLWVTAGGKLWSVPVEMKGRVHWQQK